MNLADLFSPEAGQGRRAWLDGLDQRVNQGLDHYLGPTGIPDRVRGLASLFEMFSPGADVMDAYDASGRLMQARTVPQAATAGAGMATALGSMFIPGNQRAIAQGAEAIGDSVRRFGADQAGGARLGPSPRGVSVEDEGGGLFRVFVGDSPAGNLNVSRSGEGSFMSSAFLGPEFTGQRYGSEAYDLVEQALGRRLGPSPLGLSANARPFWRRRLEALAPADRAAALRQSYEEGIALGVPDRDVRMRLYELVGRELFDALPR
jgi:hypothetical protein